MSYYKNHGIFIPVTCLLVPGLNCDDLFCTWMQCFHSLWLYLQKCILHNYKHLISALALVLIWSFYLIIFVLFQLLSTVMASVIDAWRLHIIQLQNHTHVQNKVKEPLPQCVRELATVQNYFVISLAVYASSRSLQRHWFVFCRAIHVNNC